MTPWLPNRGHSRADRKKPKQLNRVFPHTCYLHTVGKNPGDGCCLQGSGHPPKHFPNLTTRDHSTPGVNNQRKHTQLRSRAPSSGRKKQCTKDTAQLRSNGTNSNSALEKGCRRTFVYFQARVNAFPHLRLTEEQTILRASVKIPFFFNPRQLTRTQPIRLPSNQVLR